MRSLAYVDIKWLNICVFAFASELGALILYFTKLIESIINIFVKVKNSPPFLNNPLFSLTPPFLEKIVLSPPLLPN